MKNVKAAKVLAAKERGRLLEVLRERFERNGARHAGIAWDEVEARLGANPAKLWSLGEMERTGGEPDVVGRDEDSGGFVFVDCAEQSPAGRQSLCYDRGALDSRKAHKPAGSAVELAAAMGVELLTEAQYFELQELGEFDTKSSSWLSTPAEFRQRGGALFGDRRFGRVFVYQNGAQSYFSGRGFRGILRV